MNDKFKEHVLGRLRNQTRYPGMGEYINDRDRLLRHDIRLLLQEYDKLVDKFETCTKVYSDGRQDHRTLLAEHNKLVDKYQASIKANSATNLRLLEAAVSILKLQAAGDLQANIIKDAQRILTDYLMPDTLTGHQALGRLLGLFDGSEQRSAKQAWEEAKQGSNQAFVKPTSKLQEMQTYYASIDKLTGANDT